MRWVPKTNKSITKLSLAIVIVGVVLVTVFYLQRTMSTRKLKSTVASKEVKTDLAQGKCSDKTKASLSKIDDNASAAARAKAYEDQGLCYTYAQDYKSAMESYKKSQEAYKQANQSADADRIGGSVKTSEWLINAAESIKKAKENPVDDSHAGSGT